MSDVFDAVNKFFGVEPRSARKKRTDRAIDNATKGKKAKKPTLGNPEGKKKRKK